MAVNGRLQRRHTSSYMAGVAVVEDKGGGEVEDADGEEERERTVLYAAGRGHPAAGGDGDKEI